MKTFEALDKIVGFHRHEDNVVMAIGIAYYIRCAGFKENDAFLGESGEVRVYAYRGAEYWEFTVGPECLISFTYENDGRTVCEADCLKFEDAINMFQVWREEKDA